MITYVFMLTQGEHDVYAIKGHYMFPDGAYTASQLVRMLAAPKGVM